MTEETYHTYYFSDPDSSDINMHHLVIQSVLKLDGELPWRWHIEKPDDSLVDPVWDNKTNGWVENDPTSQSQIVAQLTNKVESQKKQIEQMGQSQATSLNSIAENQAKMLKMMAPLLAKGGKPNA
ncbi:hypothetical protein [Lactobacillus sp. ESL0228]|uniref:hypothetical protein n=1 Tax=Lactobacillus sp. ESL0228 TaxID=2069352 RepID=UPI000EFC76EE|nr:hypothetical protein [Lactobacillus sp. ESL0228]RMC48894.1 hypothetical protein F5ESL0228_04660 [Lactobacillus sp. ESL0228]